MRKDESFRKAIAAVNSGQRFPVISLVRDDPTLAATIAKMVAPQEAPFYGDDGNRQPMMPNLGMFQNLSQETAQNITDAQTVMQILPDMELAAQILVSSVLSPKDMMTTELTYAVTEGLLAPEVSAAMIAASRTHFEQDYKIQPLLGKILRDILFETGSYPVAVIPENSLDEVINGARRVTMESLADTLNADGTVKNKGLLGPAVLSTPRQERQAAGFAFESLSEVNNKEVIDPRVTLEGLMSASAPGVQTFLTVSDNPDLLKIPQINQKIREQRILSTIGSKSMASFGRAMESHHGKAPTISQMTDRQLSGVLYKNRNFKYKPITSMKTQEQLNRRAVGNPLILHLPSESVIPVHVPGCPEAQVGFFVLIDADGNPISKENNADYYRELSSRLTANGSFPSAMLSKVKSMMSGFNPYNQRDLDYSAKVYGEMVEKDLLARLRNGVYGNGVSIARKDEIWRIMFSRALAQQHTQLLFLPVELMTYFAFKYTSQGIGKSLMDDMKIMNSLRAMVLFSNVMASLKNSIGRTDVKLKLDDSDPNPQKTIETAMHEIIKSRSAYFPLGVNRPTDLVDYLQRAGYEFTFEGHPGLPDVSIEFGEKNTNYAKPDTELEESLRKRSIMGLGLSPENVDAGFSAEFATSILNNNILLSKRVLQMQEIFTPQLSDHLRKAMMNSEKLMSELREILENNLDKLQPKEEAPGVVEETPKTQVDPAMQKRLLVDQLLNEFVMSFEVSLPQPGTVTLENQLVALETYVKGLDATLDAYISDRFFTTDTGGDVANQVTVIKEVLRAYFLRQWMAENGVMTELAALTTMGSDDKPAVDIFGAQQAHLEALGKSLTELMKSLQPVKDANNETVSSLTVSDTPAPSSTDTGTSGDDSGLGSDTGGDFGSDFGMGGSDTGTDTGTDTSTSTDTGTGTDTEAGGGEDGNTDDTKTGEGSDAAGGEDKGGSSAVPGF